MGILDSLLGLQTNQNKNAATGQAIGYQQATGDGNNATLKGYTGLADQIRQQYGTDASNVLNDTTGQAQSYLTNAGQQAQQQLAAGTNAAVNTVQSSNGQYAPYVANGQTANGLYADSLGLNGASGNAAATGAFQAGPGYQWQVDQSTDAAARKAASLGMAASGNTLDAITRLGSNLANQEFTNWQDKLNGLSSTGLTAANAVSGNNAAAAGYQYGGGTTAAGLTQQLGGSLANTSTSLGTQQASIMNGLGSSIAGDQTNLGNALVANQRATANAVTGASLQNAASADAVQNKNSAIFGNLTGSLLGALKGTATGQGLTNAFAKI